MPASGAGPPPLATSRKHLLGLPTGPGPPQSARIMQARLLIQQYLFTDIVPTVAQFNCSTCSPTCILYHCHVTIWLAGVVEEARHIAIMHGVNHKALGFCMLC